MVVHAVPVSIDPARHFRAGPQRRQRFGTHGSVVGEIVATALISQVIEALQGIGDGIDVIAHEARPALETRPGRLLVARCL